MQLKAGAKTGEHPAEARGPDVEHPQTPLCKKQKTGSMAVASPVKNSIRPNRIQESRPAAFGRVDRKDFNLVPAKRKSEQSNDGGKVAAVVPASDPAEDLELDSEDSVQCDM